MQFGVRRRPVATLPGLPHTAACMRLPATQRNPTRHTSARVLGPAKDGAPAPVRTGPRPHRPCHTWLFLVHRRTCSG